MLTIQTMKARVITCSDAASRGEREDRSGPAVRDLLESKGYEVDAVVVVADTIEFIATAIVDGTEAGNQLVVTTGGTGLRRATSPPRPRCVLRAPHPRLRRTDAATSLRNPHGPSFARAGRHTRNGIGRESARKCEWAIENLEAVLHLIPHAIDLLSSRTTHGGTNDER